MVIQNQNKLIKHLVNRLRNITTSAHDFRTIVEEISCILITKILANSPVISKKINTWQGALEIESIDESSLVLIPILRAGQPMLTGLLKILPNAQSGFLAMKRDEATAKPHLFYENIPSLKDKTVVILDPMVATGGSLIDAINFVKSKGAQKIISLNILGSVFGSDLVAKKHPDVLIYIAQIDPDLDENKYIRPGLGDAGDRAFGTS